MQASSVQGQAVLSLSHMPVSPHKSSVDLLLPCYCRVTALHRAAHASLCIVADLVEQAMHCKDLKLVSLFVAKEVICHRWFTTIA